MTSTDRISGVPEADPATPLSLASGGTGVSAATVAALRTALGSTAVGDAVFIAASAAAARAALGSTTVGDAVFIAATAAAARAALGAAAALAHGVDIASAATLDLSTATGSLVRITGTTATSAVTLSTGQTVTCIAVGAWPLTYHATNNPVQGGASYTCAAGDVVLYSKDGAGVIHCVVFKADGTAVASAASTTVPVRQTVLSGPVDSSGFSAFGGATGSTTVTATGTLKATAAVGGDANYTGSITNPSWTGLSTNGTMYLFLDITSVGVVTTGSTTLEPTYRWGGADVVTNLQNTFNIQEMTMKVGNGSTAAQVYRVFVGEVTVAGGVVTAITWHALMGRYQSALTALPSASTRTAFSHNLGVDPQFLRPQLYVRFKATWNGYTSGMVIPWNDIANNAVGNIELHPAAVAESRNIAVLLLGSLAFGNIAAPETGPTTAGGTLATSDADVFMRVDRSW